MKVYADRYKKHMKEQKKMMEGMPKEMQNMMNGEYTPVDLYGHRVNLDKNDSTNFEKTAQDIKEYYDLESY